MIDKNCKCITLIMIILVMLTVLTSCNMLKHKGDKKMKITAGISIAEIVNNLATNNRDSIFCKAMLAAKQAQHSTDEDFLKLFKQAWEQVSPNRNLYGVFNCGSNNHLTSRSTNEDVINILEKSIEKVVDRCIFIAQKRLESMDAKVMKVQKNQRPGLFVMEVEDVDNPDWALHLVQFDANLQFWETFEYKNIYSYMDSADKRIRELKGCFSGSHKDPVNKAADTNEFGLPKEHHKQTETFEEYAKDHPLFAYLQPSLTQDDKGNYFPAKGPVVGISQIKDTGIVGEILRNPLVSCVFPSSLQFVWCIKPVGDKNNSLQLLALMKNYYGKPAMEAAEYITDAKQEIGKDKKVEISFEMNTEGAQIWKRITANNICRSVAIVLDNYVYAFPTVQNEIPNGKSQITGNFSDEEARELANMLKTGHLPAHILVLDVVITDKAGNIIRKNH